MPRPSRGRCVKDPRIGGVEETAVIGKTMRKKAALFTTAAAALLLLTGCSFFLPGAVGPGTSTDSDPVTPDPEYTAFLIAEGFSEDYAEKLSVLRVLHPAWTFEPLDVTGLSEGRYTWDYVVGEEYSDHRRNLVPPAERYIHMRDPSDLSLYDTGWYAASRPAIEYMMDPRNFLDEVQIFHKCRIISEHMHHIVLAAAGFVDIPERLPYQVLHFPVFICSLRADITSIDNHQSTSGFPFCPKPYKWCYTFTKGVNYA